MYPIKIAHVSHMNTSLAHFNKNPFALRVSSKDSDNKLTGELERAIIKNEL